MPRETYTIVITRPETCSSRRLKAYMKEAIEAWSGGFHPDDPLFKHEFHAVIRRLSVTPESKDD